MKLIDLMKAMAVRAEHLYIYTRYEQVGAKADRERTSPTLANACKFNISSSGERENPIVTVQRRVRGDELLQD